MFCREALQQREMFLSSSKKKKLSIKFISQSFQVDDRGTLLEVVFISAKFETTHTIKKHRCSRTVAQWISARFNDFLLTYLLAHIHSPAPIGAQTTAEPVSQLDLLIPSEVFSELSATRRWPHHSRSLGWINWEALGLLVPVCDLR